MLQTSGAASEQFGFDDSRNIFILFNLFPFRISLFAVTVALQSLYAWSFVIKAYHYYCYKILSFFSFPSSYCCCSPHLLALFGDGGVFLLYHEFRPARKCRS